MDNAGCLPPEMKDKYSNIKIIFLPPKTASMLQPLDNPEFQKLLLRFVISKIDECDGGHRICEHTSSC